MLATPPDRTRRFLRLLPIIILMLVYLFSRLYRVLVYPPFIDESVHIQWAQDVYSGHLLTGAANGRLLALWWMSGFQLWGDATLWLGRVSTILTGLLSVAVVYSLSRYFASRFAGLLAVALYILAPYLFFHERLTLTDIHVATWGLIAVWLCVRFVARGRSLDAPLSGLAIAATLAAKATGIMLVIVPAVVLVTLIPLAQWRKLARGLMLSYGVFGLLWGPFYLFLRLRNWNYFSVATSVVGTNDTEGVLGRLLGNLQQAISIDVTYLTAGFLVILALAGAYLIVRRWRIGLCLATVSILPVMALLLFATKVNGRYILFHVPFLIVWLSVGLVTLAADLQRRFRLPDLVATTAIAGLVLVWAFDFALPFVAGITHDPASVTLPAIDRSEYVSSDSSGFALDQVAQTLTTYAAKSNRPLRVVGLLANCLGLSHEIVASSGIVVECPYITYTGSEQSNLAALVNKRAAESGTDLWLVSENSSYISLEGITVPYQKITSFDRPDHLVRITLYHVGQ